MKKTKRFVVTSAIVASMALGTVTTAATAQTSQASAIGDLFNQITSIFKQNGASTTTTGTNLSTYKGTIVVPAGTTPDDTSVQAFFGSTPTILGLVPATVKSVDTNKMEITFGADTSSMSNSLISGLGNLVPNVKIPFKYSDNITFKNGSTTANIKKGDKFNLDNGSNYTLSNSNDQIKVIDNGGFNYAYAGTYTPTVQAVNSDNSLSSAETQLTINVLDAKFSNLDQTVIKGSIFDPNAATGQDTNGATLDMSTKDSVNTSKVGTKTITYTATDPSLGFDGNPIQWEVTGTINVVDSDSSQTINFQDANSGDIVDTTTITGADGQVKAVDAPAGYDFVNTSDATVTLQKGSHASTVKVVKTGSSVETPFSGTVATYANGGIVPLYTGDGTQTSRSLSPNSDWATDQTKTINGEKYYRVSTSEWVKASTVYEYSPVGSTITTNAGSNKSLYSIKGNKSSRALAPNTPWYTDKSTTINGTQMYRVSTDEWVIASDVH
ncbi:SLAP domain-containing protein [Companilactobacillus sp.]|uniref:SLAP domain-containing protein n=1 Tax=Companilactobacillus sp. TaxID=2767905 RepID=UPI00261544C8|nr:SLAP domain-containing protein [Companilactobacillus sp.]